MSKQSFVTGQVLTAQQVNDLQTNDFNQTVSAKTASYTLVAADKGTRITMSSTSATTITVNTGLFAAGDTLFIQNLNTGVSTITAGTATVDTSASLALAQHEGGTLYFTSAGVSTFFKAAGAAAGGGSLTLLSTTTLSGASTTISSIDQTYQSLYVLITGVTNSTNDADFRCLPNNVNNLVSMGGFDQGSIFGGIYASLITLTGTNVEYKRSDANNVWTIRFDNYASTTDMKPFIANSSFIEPSYSDSRAVFLGGTFRSNTAITSLVFDVEGETFLTGTVKIYGVK